MTFVSKRERRLWTLMLAIVLVIYATLGVVVNLLQFLEDSMWGSGIFILGCCMLLLAVVTQGLKRFPGWKEMIAGLVMGGMYAGTLMYIEHSEERIHVIMYGVVALLIYSALLERASHDRRVPFHAILVIAAIAVIGSIDELIQLTLPNRVFDLVDILYNILASVMAVSLNASLRWARGESIQALLY